MRPTDVGAAVGAVQVDLNAHGRGPAREPGGPVRESSCPAEGSGAPSAEPPEWVYAFETRSEEETKRIAEAIGSFARDGWVVLLSGPLGAGKTVFAQGLLARVGVTGRVRSPTFTIVNEYPGTPTCWHADLYRLEDGEDFAAIGGDELLLGGEGLVVVEWAQRLRGGDWLPAEHVWVDLEFAAPETPDDRRRITVRVRGGGYRDAAAGLAGLSLPAPARRRNRP